LDTLEFLGGSLSGLIGVIGEVNGLETTLLETTEGLEHTLETENLLGHLLETALNLLDILFNVDGRHFVLI
jgi:hypothetical protein